MAKELGDLKLPKEFTNINPDDLSPELLDSYKQMQSHFTKRTQEAVSARKEASDLLDVLTKEKTATEARIKELEESNVTLQTSLSKKKEVDDDDLFDLLRSSDSDRSSDAVDSKVVTELKEQITNLTGQIDTLKTDLDTKTTKAMKIIKYQQDVADIALLHQEQFNEKLDRQQLIDFAVEQNISDLFNAHKAFTTDRTIEKKATERANELYKERLAKDETFSSGTSGPDAPRLFGRGDETGPPKTMAQATKEILKELRTKV